MTTFFGILFFFSIVALILGSMEPQWVRMPSRKRAGLVFGGTSILLLIFIGMSSPAATPVATPVSTSVGMDQSSTTATTLDQSAPVAPQVKTTVIPKQTESVPAQNPVPAVATPTPAPVQEPTHPAPTWHTVTTFSGNGIKTTSPFTIQGQEWRVDWQTTGQYNFQIFPYRTDNGLSSCSLMANIIGNGSDTSYCYESGQFYLTVNTGNQWTVTVEDYY